MLWTMGPVYVQWIPPPLLMIFGTYPWLFPWFLGFAPLALGLIWTSATTASPSFRSKSQGTVQKIMRGGGGIFVRKLAPLSITSAEPPKEQVLGLGICCVSKPSRRRDEAVLCRLLRTSIPTTWAPMPEESKFGNLSIFSESKTSSTCLTCPTLSDSK